MDRWPKLVNYWWDKIKRSVLGASIIAMVVCLIGAIGGRYLDRWRLRMRAKRIGLESLPTPEQLRLVRQLGFYHDLLRVLDRHQISWPEHLTPMEFSRTLSYLPNTIYDEVFRLTQLFYRIRFGGEELNPTRLRHLDSVVHNIARAMDGADSPAWRNALNESDNPVDR
jgi:hypothetical protein